MISSATLPTAGFLYKLLRCDLNMKHLKFLNHLTSYVIEKAGFSIRLWALDSIVAANMLTPAHILTLCLV
jgi:hypothetical protein